jgi:quinolinate synthase
MSKITLQNLADVLDALVVDDPRVDARIVNQVTVSAKTARWARVALDRMLAL